ncbi:MAG: hypothetical protein ABSE39_02440 [Candidatus Bathyarchaeia archaeon]
MPVEVVVKVPIRRIPVVIDMKDPLAPELDLDDFRKLFGRDPDRDRFRVLNIEVLTSPDDLQPMLVSECGRYARFLRRESDHVYFRKTID